MYYQALVALFSLTAVVYGQSCPQGQFLAFVNGVTSPPECLCVPPNFFQEAFSPNNGSCQILDSEFIQPRELVTRGNPVNATSRHDVVCNYERSCEYKINSFECLFTDFDEETGRRLLQFCTRNGTTVNLLLNKFTECTKKYRCFSRECATNCAFRLSNKGSAHPIP